MPKPAYVGMSEDMKTAFRELIKCLLDEGWMPDDIIGILEKCLDPSTEFFGELSELILD